MVRVIYEVSRLAARFKKGEMSTEDSDHLNEVMRQAIDTEIERFTNLYKLKVISESRKMEYNVAAARIQSQEASDRLIRYEAQLSREFDRTLNQLERLQRMPKGQPVLPPIKVEVSS